jgi:S-adenosylmethionine:tRNA ribosyltransferase-isomerase
VSIPSEFQRSAYAYNFDPALIAQSPATPRDSSRLLVYHRGTGATSHTQFSHLDDFLHEGDLLVVNTTRVMPVRLFPLNVSAGTEIELFLLRARTPRLWEALVKPGKRARVGTKLAWRDETEAVVIESLPDGSRVVEFSRDVTPAWLDTVGKMPLPPYIKREAEESDKERYQTVYAQTPGAVAAPTAGLHLTEPLLERIAAKGARRAEVLLHVGIGTFRPVRADDIREHPMESEYYEVSAETLERIRETRRNGGRIVAVGTTSVRTLETLAQTGQINSRDPVSGWTRIFIHPPYAFQLVDAIITNFHLPESTLIMLVSAFAGREQTLALYDEAVRLRYRLYSYGDGMLIS